MREEIIVSGRANPLIDPHLHIWHWQIPLYLFLGGLAAGILFFAGLFTIMGKEKKFHAAVKIAPHIVPFVLVIGLLALILDLKHKLYFWRLYTTIRLESPMSWGAWVLMLVTPLSLIWSAIHIKEIFPRWNWRFRILFILEEFFTKYKLAIAWVMAIASIILGVYTGILFSAFNARPLWNTSILGPLFLASGLSAGAATIMLFSKNHKERNMFAKIDIGIIGMIIPTMNASNKKTTKTRYINPYLGGVLLGIVLIAANFIAGRGLGASGAAKSAIVATVNTVAPNHAENAPFYREYNASHPEGPMKAWLVFQMLGVIAGAFLSGAVFNRLKLKVEHSPKITSTRRIIFAVMGGILFGFGSQLGRGCTSGSALSGMAVLSYGGFISMAFIFGTAFALAYFLRKNWIQ